MKIITTLVMSGLIAASIYAEDTRQLGWEDLTVTVEFEDPFEKLTSEQLMELSIFARIQMLEKAGRDVSKGMKEEMVDAEASLRKQGVDIEGLLAKREEIKNLREKRASAMDDNLNGKTIRMPGYALALEYDGKKVKEFLLVP
jgi:hypothetical protein